MLYSYEDDVVSIIGVVLICAGCDIFLSNHLDIHGACIFDPLFQLSSIGLS